MTYQKRKEEVCIIKQEHILQLTGREIMMQ